MMMRKYLLMSKSKKKSLEILRNLCSLPIKSTENLEPRNSDIQYIENVGRCEKKLQHDGKFITIIYPVMYYPRRPKLLNNFKSTEEEGNDPFKKARNAKRKDYKDRPLVKEECIQGTNYCFEDDLRKVKPYYFAQELFNRRLEKTLNLGDCIDEKIVAKTKTLSKVIELENDLVFINMKPAKKEDLVRKNDVIASIVHRHENPVIDQDIEIIYENEDILVVNKIPTMPIYPQGGYRYNTLLFVLAIEKGYRNLRPIHRIDRATSGICILAKNCDTSAKYQSKFSSLVKEKKYIARVDGYFPEGVSESNEPLQSNHFNQKGYKGSQNLQESCTVFELVSRDEESNTSLVKCYPKTGRTHQIRRHLLSMGFPIVNDMDYNMKDISRRMELLELIDSSNKEAYDQLKMKSEWKRKSDGSISERFGKSDFCIDCHVDPKVTVKINNHIKENVMCLHSYHYDLENMQFEASWPKWATSLDYFKENINKNR